MKTNERKREGKIWKFDRMNFSVLYVIMEWIRCCDCGESVHSKFLRWFVFISHQTRESQEQMHHHHHHSQSQCMVHSSLTTLTLVFLVCNIDNEKEDIFFVVVKKVHYRLCCLTNGPGPSTNNWMTFSNKRCRLRFAAFHSFSLNYIA